VAVAIVTGLEELGAEEQVELGVAQLLVAVLITLALGVEETTRVVVYPETVGLESLFLDIRLKEQSQSVQD
jgi:hypothetical protein